ncbi:MAG: DUF4242 domain-containing protein [Deltaproteobacteria bacterium]|nr:DUF4242 domain-containing protein [Deltaproteobacteria bacterium]
MEKMKKFMAYHYDPDIDCNVVQANWRKLAKVASVTWIRTYINWEKGMRYCIWLAHSEEELKDIFNEMDVKWETIVEVVETVPDLWGEKWEEHLAAEEAADTKGN